MKKHTLLIVQLFFLVFFSQYLSAQVPSMPTVISFGIIENFEAKIGKLSECYLIGDWDGLQIAMDEITNEINAKSSAKRSIDPSRNFYIVIFFTSPKNGDQKLVRFVYTKPISDRYASRIPGKTSIFEIALLPKAKISLRTFYTSTKIENPILAQIPKAVKILEPVIPFYQLGQDRKLKPPANYEIRSVALPFKRAKIQINDVATISQEAFLEGIKKSACELGEQLKLRKTDQNNKRERLIDKIVSKIYKIEPNQEIDKSIKLIHDEINKEVNNYFNELRAIPNSDNKEKEKTFAEDTEKSFLEIMKKVSTKEISANYEFENAPLERCSFGLLSTFLFSNSNTRERVKVTDAGFYANEPPKNPLPSVIFNFHPWKYDPKSENISLAERFRLFVGGILTPDIGGCVGAGFEILRGLSINAGIARIGFRSANNPQTVVVEGIEMTKPGDKNNPYSSKWGNVFFWGISYNFQ